MIFACAASSGEAAAGRCPSALDGATHLIVVTTPSLQSSSGAVEAYERRRAGAKWRKTLEAVPALVGRNGLGWGVGFRHLAKTGEPIKEEGDKRTPMGVYPVDVTFGHGTEAKDAKMVLEKDQHICVDDLASPHYGLIVPRSVAGETTRGEKMWEYPEYRRGAAVRYPANREAKGGSCIFLHVVAASAEPTSGCVALAEGDMAALQKWIKHSKTTIAIVSGDTRDRLSRCLPQ